MNLEDDISRIPLPKWKALEQTPTDELKSSRGLEVNKNNAVNRSDRAYSLYERWRATPSLGNALELIDSSLFLEDVGIFYGPASQILASNETTRTSKLVAQSVLAPSNRFRSAINHDGNRTDIYAKIANNKAKLHSDFRNGLLHTEQARLYTIIGEVVAAERSFFKALAIAPNNRHILRSFSRFMIHVGDAEVARLRLAKSPAINHDPWLQAAEISLAVSENKGSSTAKLATKNLNERRIAPAHVSELAAAMATLERSAGHRKNFKKRLNESLLQPTDNALAQAMWYLKQSQSNLEDIERVNPTWLPLLRRSREALTYTHLRAGKWKDAATSFLRWQSEEQFSSHIGLQGSYYAVSFAGDYEVAIFLCENALYANQRSASLLNNLCVAQRRIGKISDSVDTFSELKLVTSDWSSDPTFLATAAMLHFAKGNIELGRYNYVDALEIAAKKGDEALQHRLRMHWLFEEADSGATNETLSKSMIGKFEATESFMKLDDELKAYWSVLKAQIGRPTYGREPQIKSQHLLEKYF